MSLDIDKLLENLPMKRKIPRLNTEFISTSPPRTVTMIMPRKHSHLPRVVCRDDLEFSFAQYCNEISPCLEPPKDVSLKVGAHTNVIIHWQPNDQGRIESMINVLRESNAYGMAQAMSGSQVKPKATTIQFDCPESLAETEDVDYACSASSFNQVRSFAMNVETIGKIFLTTPLLARWGYKGMINVREILNNFDHLFSDDESGKSNVLVLDLTYLCKSLVREEEHSTAQLNININDYLIYYDNLGIKNFPVFVITGRFDLPTTAQKESP